MPIGPYDSFEACTLGIMREQGVDELSARKICGKMEAEASITTLEKIRAAAMSKPVETFEVGGNRYAKFFLVSTAENQNDWSVTPESIPQYLGSFVGMPFVSDDTGETGAAFDHLGLQPPFNKEVHEILKIQERPSLKAATIIDVQYKPEKGEAYAVVRFENTPHGRKVYEDLKNGEAIYTSPAITGYARDIGGHLVYHAWYGVHLARVKKPAYGVMAASIKATCEGPEKTCLMQLATAAKHVGAPCIMTAENAEGSNSSVIPKASSRAQMDCNDPAHANDPECKAMAALKDQVASLTKERDELKTKLATSEGLAAKFDDIAKKYGEIEARTKKAIATEIASMEKEAEIIAADATDKRVEALEKLDLASLESEKARIAPYVAKIKSLATVKPEHPLAGEGKLVHQVASSSDKGAAPSIATVDDMRRELGGLV